MEFPPLEKEEARYVSCRFDDDGMRIIQGRFFSEEGAVLTKVLQAMPTPKVAMDGHTAAGALALVGGGVGRNNGR